MPRYDKDEDPFREGGEYEEAQVAIGSRYGLDPETSALAGAPSRAVGREIVRRGFSLFGGHGVSERIEQAKRFVKDAERVEKNAHEIERIARSLLKLFR